MRVTVDDFLVSQDLAPMKLLTSLASPMWGSPAGGCFVLTVRGSRQVAATQKVRTISSVCTMKAAWPSGKGAGLLHQRSQVQIVLPVYLSFRMDLCTVVPL